MTLFDSGLHFWATLYITPGYRVLVTKTADERPNCSGMTPKRV